MALPTRSSYAAGAVSGAGSWKNDALFSPMKQGQDACPCNQAASAFHLLFRPVGVSVCLIHLHESLACFTSAIDRRAHKGLGKKGMSYQLGAGLGQGEGLREFARRSSATCHGWFSWAGLKRFETSRFHTIAAITKGVGGCCVQIPKRRMLDPRCPRQVNGQMYEIRDEAGLGTEGKRCGMCRLAAAQQRNRWCGLH